MLTGLSAPSYELRHVELPIMKMKQCRKVHASAEVNSSIPITPQKNICAGGEKSKLFIYFIPNLSQCEI